MVVSGSRYIQCVYIYMYICIHNLLPQLFSWCSLLSTFLHQPSTNHNQPSVLAHLTSWPNNLRKRSEQSPNFPPSNSKPPLMRPGSLSRKSEALKDPKGKPWKLWKEHIFQLVKLELWELRTPQEIVGPQKVLLGKDTFLHLFERVVGLGGTC